MKNVLPSSSVESVSSSWPGVGLRICKGNSTTHYMEFMPKAEAFYVGIFTWDYLNFCFENQIFFRHWSNLLFLVKFVQPGTFPATYNLQVLLSSKEDRSPSL